MHVHGAFAHVRGHDASAHAVAPDQEVEKMLAADAAALQTFKEQPIAILPVPLESLQPLIYTQEQVAGGVICSALMWSARNLVRCSDAVSACLLPSHRRLTLYVDPHMCLP